MGKGKEQKSLMKTKEWKMKGKMKIVIGTTMKNITAKQLAKLQIKIFLIKKTIENVEEISKTKFGGDKPSFTPGRNKNSSGNSGGGTKGDFKNRPAKGAKPKFRVSIKSKSKHQSKSNSKRKAK